MEQATDKAVSMTNVAIRLLDCKKYSYLAMGVTIW